MNFQVKSLDEVLRSAARKPLTRSLGSLQLMLLGVGSIIGTGIFVLTAEAATKAGPAMMISFVIAAVVCGLTALCYAEVAAMIPVSGSAYTFAYVTFGEVTAWLVGWALVLEYAIAASAISVGWSGYMAGLIRDMLGVELPVMWTHGPMDDVPGWANVPAMAIALIMTALLYWGTTESARFNAALVVVKVSALVMFLVLALPLLDVANFSPFNPYGFFKSELAGTVSHPPMAVGVAAAASSIFFAYVGFDAVSTAAEETRNPSRSVPIGLLGSLLVCTVLYLLVAAGAIGAIGAQPDGALAKSDDALALVMRELDFPFASKLLQIAAGVALPSVILMMMYGQTRIAFVMARDGLLPEALARVHPRFHTPHIITLVTGVLVAILAALFPIGQLADISNSGTLFAFVAVTLGALILRVREPGRLRPFRTPALWIIAPSATLGCLFLFTQLSLYTHTLFAIWLVLGTLFYLSYGRRRSHLRRGESEVHELDADAPPGSVIRPDIPMS